MGASVSVPDTADMADVEVSYDGRVAIVGEVCGALAGGVVGVVAVANGSGVLALFFVAAVGWGIWDAVQRQGWFVALETNGDLVVAKLSGEQRIPVRSVRSIRRRAGGEGPSTFRIVYDGGSCILVAGARARALVDELILRNPSITVKGYRVQ
jgi:hypothetical protein